MYNMGYPFFVIAPVFALFGDSLPALRVANALLGVSATYLCYLVAKEAGAGRNGQLLAACAWAFYIPSSVYTVYAFKENLLTPVMLAALWCALRFVKEARLGVAVVCGILFGLIALCGNAGLAVALPVIMVLAPTFMKALHNRRAIVSIGLVAALVTTPWLMRNMAVLGEPVLNTNGGFNFYLGNNENATGEFISIADTPMGDKWQGLLNLNEAHASNVLKAEAHKWIAAHPDQFAVLAVKKLILFWTPPYHDGKGPQSTKEKLARTVWLVQFLLLATGAAGTLFLRHGTRQQNKVLWCAIVAYTALHMLVYVMPRYREPIMPVVCILAAVFAERMFAAWPALKHRYAGRPQQVTETGYPGSGVTNVALLEKLDE